LPNIIHSIDAAIMRIVTKRLHERTGYTINYLHDCVLLHPNHVDIYYEIITELFTSKDFLNMADNLFFDAIKTDLDIDTAEQISNIQKEFLEVSNDLVIEQEKYRAYSVYPFKS
jgi:DNA-directed RNA polymerase